MYAFGKRSRDNLDTCHKDIIAICEELIKFYDFSVIEGLRTQERQQQLFREGKTKIDGVTKKGRHQGEVHNGKLVSMAVDIIPYKKGTNPFDNNEKERARFYFMMGAVAAIAERLFDEGKITHKVRFGLDWAGTHVYTDNSFDDLPHFELVQVK